MEFQREVVVLFDTVQIRYYGIIIVVAMLVAAAVAARLAKRDGKDPDHVWGALTWAIIPAIVLARLWFVFTPSEALIGAPGCLDDSEATVCIDTAWMLQNFFDTQNGAIAIWSGGLSIFGAVIGGLLGALIYFRRNRLPVWEWLDIAGVVLPLGQAIGRWANFINQELYGDATTLPWGITIDADKRISPYRSLVDYPLDTTLFHPLFLYESLWNLMAFIVLINLYQRRAARRLLAGDIFLIYIMQYAVIRFLLEFIRADTAFIAGTTINSSQTITALAFIAALGLFLYRRRGGAVERNQVQQTGA